MKNSRLRLLNLVMYCDVSLVRHQHLLYVAPYTFGESCDVVKMLPKMIHFVNGYDNSTLSYKKEPPNKRVVTKIR